MQFTIRQAAVGDIDGLSALAVTTFVEAFGHSFTESDLKAHLQRSFTPERFLRFLEEDVILLAESEGLLVGYTQFGDSADAETWGEMELRKLYVLPDFQNRGVGSALLDFALQHPRMTSARRIHLDVWEHNPDARRLYERFGFRVRGTREFLMESGVSDSLDLVMVRVNER